jgi:hypothetical protein
MLLVKEVVFYNTMRYGFGRNPMMIVKMNKVFSQRRYVMDIVYVGIVVALFVLSLLFVKLAEKV